MIAQRNVAKRKNKNGERDLQIETQYSPPDGAGGGCRYHVQPLRLA